MDGIMPKEKEKAVLIDPDLYMKRMLHYQERHAAWYIFKAIYWAIYLFVVGLLFMVQSIEYYPVAFTFGTALVVLAVMVAIYGMVNALHNKLMKKYA
jgi:hypothetical protein